MLKYILLVWWCICVAPVKPCNRCLVSIFCTNNGLVFDGESDQACILLPESYASYSAAQNHCQNLDLSSRIWKPSTSLTQRLSAQRPELRAGNPTITWASYDTKRAAKIGGNGLTVTRLKYKNFTGKTVRTICCISQFTSQFARPGFQQTLSSNIQTVAPNAIINQTTDFCPINDLSSSRLGILTSVSAYETNSEIRSNRVKNLFNSNENKVYKSLPPSDNSQPIHVIQFFSFNESLLQIVLKSNSRIPPEFELYGGSEFKGESNITEDYEYLGNQFNDVDPDTQTFRIFLQPGNCYNLIILYITNVTEQISLYEFSARSLAIGRAVPEEDDDSCPRGYDAIADLCLSINCNEHHDTVIESDNYCELSSGRAATFDFAYQVPHVQQYLEDKRSEGCEDIWYGWRNPSSSIPRYWEFPVVGYQPFNDSDFTRDFWQPSEPAGTYRAILGFGDQFRGYIYNNARGDRNTSALCRYYFGRAPNPAWSVISAQANAIVVEGNEGKKMYP